MISAIFQQCERLVCFLCCVHNRHGWIKFLFSVWSFGSLPTDNFMSLQNLTFTCSKPIQPSLVTRTWISIWYRSCKCLPTTRKHFSQAWNCHCFLILKSWSKVHRFGLFKESFSISVYWWMVVNGPFVCCHGSAVTRRSKTRSRCHCLANFRFGNGNFVGQMAELVSGLWHSRNWNDFVWRLCETGDSQWLRTRRFEKNTPGFSDHVQGRPIVQRAHELYGFLQSSPWFVWSKCCMVSIGDHFVHLVLFETPPERGPY